MFENVGKKLQDDAKIFFSFVLVFGVLGVIISIVVAIVIENFAPVVGYLIGSLIAIGVSAVLARLIYGFGILVEKTEKDLGMTQNVANQPPRPVTQPKPTPAPAKQRKAEKTEFVFDEDELNPFAEDAEFVDVKCPNCKEQLSFVVGTKNGSCPSCGTNFYL